ncbi:MAG: metallophosphoesterase [Candidatus Peregrinibacteria bacterium]
MKIGLVSDIHEDIKRLKEALVVFKKEKCRRVVCLGDFTGFTVPYYGFLQSRNAYEVIRVLRKNCDVIVVGNHDLFAVRKLPKYKAGFLYPKNWYSLDFRTRQKLSKNKVYLYENNDLSALLTKEDKRFIRKLPEYVVKKYGSLKILFSHYAFPDLVGTKTFEPKIPRDVREHFGFMKKHGCTLGISGHDHREGMTIFTEKTMNAVSFNKAVKLTNNPTWLYGPSVGNGTFANGVLVFDIDKMEIKAIPLKTKKRVL